MYLCMCVNANVHTCLSLNKKYTKAEGEQKINSLN